MFHMNEGGCALVLQKDLEYWIIGNRVGPVLSEVSPVYAPLVNSFGNESFVKVVQQISKALKEI